MSGMADWLINGRIGVHGQDEARLSVVRSEGVREVGIAVEHERAILALIEPYLQRLEDESKFPTDVARVRAWAREAGYDVPARGRLSTELLAAYRDATGHMVVDRSGRRRPVTTIEDVRRLTSTGSPSSVIITVEAIVVDENGNELPFHHELLDEPSPVVSGPDSAEVTERERDGRSYAWTRRL